MGRQNGLQARYPVLPRLTGLEPGERIGRDKTVAAKLPVGHRAVEKGEIRQIAKRVSRRRGIAKIDFDDVHRAAFAPPSSRNECFPG